MLPSVSVLRKGPSSVRRWQMRDRAVADRREAGSPADAPAAHRRGAGRAGVQNPRRRLRPIPSAAVRTAGRSSSPNPDCVGARHYFCRRRCRGPVPQVLATACMGSAPDVFEVKGQSTEMPTISRSMVDSTSQIGWHFGGSSMAVQLRRRARSTSRCKSDIGGPERPHDHPGTTPRMAQGTDLR